MKHQQTHITYWLQDQPSSRSVKRAICGKSLKVSRQMTPAVCSSAIITWSCLTNLGLFVATFPVLRSINAFSCCNQDKKKTKKKTWSHIGQGTAGVFYFFPAPPPPQRLRNCFSLPLRIVFAPDVHLDSKVSTPPPNVMEGYPSKVWDLDSLQRKITIKTFVPLLSLKYSTKN